MTQPPPGRPAGQFMLVACLVVGLGLLTLLFDFWLEGDANPNQRPISNVTDTGVREVLLERNRQGHYVATGRINQENARFLLDTGATDVVVSAELADKAGLQRGYAGRASTANGIITVYSTIIDELQLGNIVLRDTRASINPAMSGDTVLLGMSALQQVEFTQRDEFLTLRHMPQYN